MPHLASNLASFCDAKRLDFVVRGFFILAMRLHRERGRRSDDNKKSASSGHAHLGGPRTGLFWIHGENTPEWAHSATIQNKDCRPCQMNDEGKCARFSEVASFSSSLKRLLWVVGYVGRLGSPWVSVARHPPRVGGKHSKRRGQTQRQTAACRKIRGRGAACMRAGRPRSPRPAPR